MLNFLHWQIHVYKILGIGHFHENLFCDDEVWISVSQPTVVLLLLFVTHTHWHWYLLSVRKYLPVRIHPLGVNFFHDDVD